MAIDAIARRDVIRLKLAIEADILDGMDLLGKSIFEPAAGDQAQERQGRTA
jgi:hypothetical protein